MSTRANIIIKDDQDQLWFYRHSDGYPSVTLPSLQRFVDWVKDGKIRNNVGQAAGWLILLGNAEYDTGQVPSGKEGGNFNGWKVGAYEPTTGHHPDVEYVYTIDLMKAEVSVKES